MASFPWHQQQRWALRAATDTIVVVGGNQSGKSTVGQGIVSALAHRTGPIYRRLRNPEGRTLKLWVAPQTDEKAKSLWEGLCRQALAGLKPSYVQSPHRVFKWRDAHGGGELWIKSQEQGFLAFESDICDLVLFDEEPADRRVVQSARTRLSTTNGVVVLTYTPLLGMTWTYDELYAPVAERPEYRIADRVWRQGNAITVIQQGMKDNPASVEGGGVYRIETDPAMSLAEKDARLYGKYGYTEGLLIPQFATLTTDRESIYLLDQLPADRGYEWVLTCDPNKRHGALLTAIDHEQNRYYCAEHYAENLPDSEHAKAYGRMLAEFGLRADDVAIYADPGGAGAQAILNLSELGYFARAVPKDPHSVAASIKRFRRQAHLDPHHRHPVTGQSPAPRCYFLRSLESVWRAGGTVYRESRLLWELRRYRQKENAAPDTPVKVDDDVVDCLRYVELSREEGAEARPRDQQERQRARLDPVSRHEAEAFDKLLAKLHRSTDSLLLS